MALESSTEYWLVQVYEKTNSPGKNHLRGLKEMIFRAHTRLKIK